MGQNFSTFTFTQSVKDAQIRYGSRKNYDWNCPQHITPRYTKEEITQEIEKLNPELIESCQKCD